MISSETDARQNRQMRHRRALPLLVVVAALALAGCSPDIPVDGPEPIRSHSTPSATPPTPAKPALDHLVVGPDGLGDLAIGEPVPEADASVGLVTWNATACAESGLTAGQPYAGLWQAAYPADPSGPLQPDPFRVGVAGGVQGGAIVAIGVNSPQVATQTGVHLLSTAGDVQAAYSTATKSTFATSDVYSVAGTGSHRLDIEVLHGDAGPQLGGKVIIMTASDGAFPVSAFYGGDGGVGSCPV